MKILSISKRRTTVKVSSRSILWNRIFERFFSQIFSSTSTKFSITQPKLYILSTINTQMTKVLLLFLADWAITENFCNFAKVFFILRWLFHTFISKRKTKLKVLYIVGSVINSYPTWNCKFFLLSILFEVGLG